MVKSRIRTCWAVIYRSRCRHGWAERVFLSSDGLVGRQALCSETFPTESAGTVRRIVLRSRMYAAAAGGSIWVTPARVPTIRMSSGVASPDSRSGSDRVGAPDWLPTTLWLRRVGLGADTRSHRQVKNGFPISILLIWSAHLFVGHLITRTQVRRYKGWLSIDLSPIAMRAKYAFCCPVCNNYKENVSTPLERAVSEGYSDVVNAFLAVGVEIERKPVQVADRHGEASRRVASLSLLALRL